MNENIVKSLKVGSEDFILMRLPASRFRNNIPKHYYFRADSKQRYNVALLIQSCDIYSFDNDEIGQTYEFHFWLQIKTFNPDSIVKHATIMFPTMHWMSLISAVSNNKARSYLESFGFNPLTLEKVDFQEHGGVLKFSKGKEIEWSIPDHGKVLSNVGVKHFIFMSSDSSDSTAHRVEALLSDTVMEQLGKIHIKTNSLEPFLLEGERLPAVIHRIKKINADVNWQRQ